MARSYRGKWIGTYKHLYDLSDYQILVLGSGSTPPSQGPKRTNQCAAYGMFSTRQPRGVIDNFSEPTTTRTTITKTSLFASTLALQRTFPQRFIAFLVTYSFTDVGVLNTTGLRYSCSSELARIVTVEISLTGEYPPSQISESEMDPMSVGSTSSTQEEPQEKRVVQSQEQQEQPQQQIQQNSKPNPNLDPHVKPKPKTIHADATVEHLEEAPHPPEEAAKILVRDALVSAAVTAEVARGTDDNTPPSEETMNGGSRSTITVTTTLATSTDEAGSPSETPEASTVEAGDRGDGPSKVVRTSSRVPDSGSVVQAVQDEGNEAEQVGAFCVVAAPISLSEAARQLLPASSSGNGDPKLDIAQDLEPSTVPTEILGKGKASSSPSAIAAPFPIHKAAPRSVVPYFGESDVEVEREIRSWLTPSLNSSTPTLATSDTWHKPPQTPTAPVIRQKPLQRKMSYSASGSGSGSTALNIPSTTLASTNSPARVNGLSGAVRPNAPETRDAPPRSAFALTAAALTNASMPGGTNGPPGTTPHHTHDDESDPEMHEPDRWGAVQLHEHHHERELDRRSRELDRRERELERRERELERRMREFDSERARWSTEVKSAPAWSEALSTLAAQMDARFNEERKKAEEREVKWARALQRGLLARVQEAIERERRLYGVPERMSEQEVNELMESSVGWLMQSVSHVTLILIAAADTPHRMKTLQTAYGFRVCCTLRRSV